MDRHTKAQRRRNMQAIHAKNTTPEMLVRKRLFADGFRYRLHDKRLPGSPDLVLPKYRCVVFVNGCFWHGHNCDLFHWPQTNREFWHAKITRNQQRDAEVEEQLRELGWRVLTVWECQLRPEQRNATLLNLEHEIRRETGDESEPADSLEYLAGAEEDVRR